MNLTLFIQSGVNEVVTGAAAPGTAEAEINLFDLALKGGWIMIPIGLLLFISLVVLTERIFVISKAGRKDDTFMNRIRDYIHEGKIDSAVNLCRMAKTPNARMIEKGISRLGRSTNDIQVAIENAGNLEIAKLEKGFPWVATTAAVAPMLGFLGTVTGMVRAFFNMANAGSGVNVALLSSGIYEALVTTVAGLIVGIIALLSYNYLVARVNEVVNAMESRSMEFMDLLNEPSK
ncbi:MAG: MotA/TolQ/ExbB proton channel family protein [Dysgonamonadaceae bacterium]|jgi:biopolymer transport protein ExbB|nr:MotA/TolQ/ExbB proton channel family protein [Dysgonamonadaceae bacterium]